MRTFHKPLFNFPIMVTTKSLKIGKERRLKSLGSLRRRASSYMNRRDFKWGSTAGPAQGVAAKARCRRHRAGAQDTRPACQEGYTLREQKHVFSQFVKEEAY